ncbi:phosphoribosylanthranilate isomerase [Leeia oryzae]|uniref:phosphoribosylanthranilate isomerase n=1 Tax=Leeia oryzae TaxID=356662 RepID=UPI000370E9D8|nr:phosphoribosylanthranilate isomerase [Leeia oryzae]
MSLKQARVRVKICGLTRAQDVQSAVNAGADALGFVFYSPSPRAVSVDKACDLVRLVPAFVTRVGLFVDADDADVYHTMEETGLDLLQFHGDESPAYCRQFKRPYIKAVRVKPGLDLVQYAEMYSDAAGLLLDAYVPGVPGGTGEQFDWQLIPERLALPVILAGGLDAGNVGRAIARVRPWAVDVSGGVEASKGVKDDLKISAFINAVMKSELTEQA